MIALLFVFALVVDLEVSRLGVVVNRMDKFGKAEQKKAVTIDRIYPFHSDHITVCAGDAADPDDLVTTLNMNDYAPDKEEEDKLMQEEGGNDYDKKEKLTNDLAEIGHVLDDEFCEYVRPDPDQQIALTGQGNIDFDKVWREVEEVDERLLLNDILPPGLHGEKWSGNVTRSALTQYHNDVENYIQKKLAAPPHVWGSDSGADICASPTSSFTGPRTPDLSSSTSTRVDGDDDDDDDDQSNQVFTSTERDGNDDNDDDGSSSAFCLSSP